MQEQRPIAVQAVISRDAESAIFLSGLRQTVVWLERARCPVPKVALRVVPALQKPSREQPVDIAMVSFIGDATGRSADFEAVARARRRQIEDFTAATDAPLFLCTVFRHLATPPDGDRDAAMAQRERIRRINLLIAELSQSTGAFVIDIDSVMAHLGGARLRSDFTLEGDLGAAAAGEAIASALLNEGLEGLADAAGAARAAALHGGRSGVMKRLNAAIGGGADAGA